MLSTHTPPFKHGREAHSSLQLSSASVVDAKGGGQRQVKIPTPSTQTPPFKQGLSQQLSYSWQLVISPPVQATLQAWVAVTPEASRYSLHE